MNLYKLSAQLIVLVVFFIMFPLVLVTHDLLRGMVVTVTFAMIVLWSIASAKAGKAGYDERESKVAARAHGFTLMLSFSYVMLIAMVVKEFDFGSLLPLAIYSIVPFQIIASRLIFEVLKHMPNAEGAAGG